MEAPFDEVEMGSSPEGPLGLVFDVQSLSLHDGPGIRTVVFLKGCPLNCVWCSNPEGQRMGPELRHRRHACEQCHQCEEACPERVLIIKDRRLQVDQERCSVCEQRACLAACPTRALTLCGRWLTTAEVMRKVHQDARYYRGKGGVTLSGGEPLMQPAFCRAVFEACQQEYINTVVETCGHVPWYNIEPLAPFVDLFLSDLKLMNSDLHRRWTGVGNELVLENLHRLVRTRANVAIRIPIVPGCNDDVENASTLAELMRELGLDRIELLPLHRLGADKFEQIGRCAGQLESLSPPSSELLAKLTAVIQQRGILCISQ